MYVIYLDESGDPNGWKRKQNHFVIAGIAVHEGQISSLGDLLDDIQAKYFPDISFPIKFHATDINGGSERFRRLGKSERQQMLDDVYDAIAQIQYPRAVLFATAIHVSAVTSPEQSLSDTFEDIVQRVNTFLVRLHHQGNPQKGLLIIDRNQTTEPRYLTLISDFKREGTRHGYLGNIVDIPYFSQSGDTRLLQLADFCAYAVFRYYERGDSQFLDKIMPQFDGRSKDSPRDGLKHIIQTAAPCECVACSWRRPEDWRLPTRPPN